MFTRLSLLVFFALTAATASAQAPLEERLKKWLKQFPKADANGDGVLTVEEAVAYRDKLAETPEPTAADVAYGPHDRNVLDFYQADSETPTPLVIYIHGGGFVGGDKQPISPGLLHGELERGISFATIRYRFVDGQDVLFPVPQHDGARAVQFLRTKADEWNIDPDRVGCFGGSAGAGISMWIGFHDDLANPESEDPVLRQSTRIRAVGTLGGQSTYDPIQIKKLIGGRAWEHPSLFLVYGLKSPEEALNPTAEMQALYDEASAITHLTNDDPPLYMLYNEADGPLPPDARPGQGIHHPNFGRHLKTAMDDLGIENVFVYTPDHPTASPEQELMQFFEKHLRGDAAAPSRVGGAALYPRSPAESAS